jgi:hypothetical protein
VAAVTNSIFDAAGLPSGWRGYVMETACRKPWLVWLYRHDGPETIRLRAITKDKAVAAAVRKAKALLDRRR